ncbi:hypothetical protein [Planomicrobium okeanokoites]|uniref:hypothetical protein n=1 Tax=Planomicrobium okeanokoites TaxID=244 RepID=UPI0015C49E37|nr:hypothetical protein [Planomicrobium okeanokoites]
MELRKGGLTSLNKRCKKSLNNNVESTQALNDLIVGALLTKYKLNRSEGQKYLEVPIHPDKIYLLQDYIENHHLLNLVKINSKENVFYILPSLMLEYKLKDWTADGIVTAINPADLHISALLFWISLYARKSEYSVVVDTQLSRPLQETLCYFFEINIKDCEIVSIENRFHFKSFLKLYLLSKSYRPYAETGEFYDMLNTKEARKLKNMIAQEKDKGEVVF